MDVDEAADSIDDLASELDCDVDQIIAALRTAKLIDSEQADELTDAMER